MVIAVAVPSSRNSLPGAGGILEGEEGGACPHVWDVPRAGFVLYLLHLTFARATHRATDQHSASVERVPADFTEDLGPVATEKRARLEIGGDDVAIWRSPSLLHTTLMTWWGTASRSSTAVCGGRCA